MEAKQILMKVTSRGRPNELLHCIAEHIKFADNTKQMTWLISLDYDDDKCNSVALCDSIAHLIDNPNIVFATSISKIDAINRDVNEFTEHWDILLNISDDQLPIIKGYDTIIRDTMPNDLDYSLWFNDGWQNKINTQEIIGYNYYKRTNKIYHPGFKSFFCDNLETERADKLDKQIKSTQCIIKHFHPGWCKDTHMTMDQTYNKCQKDWSQDEALYNKLKNEL
jgi:hypothetical protein